MENASKALIIAGAVLIAILLISVGIMLMTSSNDVTGEAENLSSSMNGMAENKVNAIQNALTY